MTEEETKKLKEIAKNTISELINEQLDSSIIFSYINNLEQKVKQLEETNSIFALEGSKVKLELYIKENYISKQRIKNRIEELKLLGGSDGKDITENLARELSIEILEELL